MEKKITKAVIPAAGMGTRFLPATKVIPKEMFPILDKPTIQYIIEEAQEAGITDVLIITANGKESIIDHFDKSLELESFLEESGKAEKLEEIVGVSNLVRVHSIRQKEAKGLGHAISCAETFVGDEPFLVMLGDDVVEAEKTLTAQLIEAYDKMGSSVIALMEVEDQDVSKYGIIEGENLGGRIHHVKNMVEKPSLEEAPSNLAIMGRYILSPRIFEHLRNVEPGRNKEIQLTDALHSMAREENIYGCEFEGHRYDIGNKLGFLIANIEFALRDPSISENVKKYLRELDLDSF